MILIISAMQEEESKIIDLIKNKREESLTLEKKIIIGEIGNKKVISLQTGIGKVNAALWTATLIAKYKISHIINSGSAGSISDNLAIGDIVISNEVAYHDFNLTQFGLKIGQIPNFEPRFKSDEVLLSLAKNYIDNNKIAAHIGLILTGDQFIDSEEKINKIKENFPDAIALEMEAASIAHVAKNFNIPFIVTRAISDIPKKGKNEIDFKKFLEKAAVNSALMSESLITNL